MKMLLFAVHDIKAGACVRPPFGVLGRGQAVRMFADMANNLETDIGQHPEDYSLLEIGEFSQVDGVLTPRDGGPLSLGTGLSFLNPASGAGAGGAGSVSLGRPVVSTVSRK